MQADFLASFARAQQSRGPVAVALEMVEQQYQPALDRFNRGELWLPGLAAATDWPTRWGWDFNLYAPVFEVARANRMPLVALNTKAETQRQVPLRGLAALSEEERARYIPDALGFADSVVQPGFREYAERVVMASYSMHIQQGWLGSQEEKVATPRNFLEARILRDEAMAAGVWRCIQEGSTRAYGGEPARSVVVLVGGDHVRFEYGVGQRLRRLGAGTRYRVAAPSLGVRASPDPTASVAATLVKGQVFQADEVVPAEGDLRYARLSDGRGFVLVSAPGEPTLAEALPPLQLRVATVMLNPTPADSCSEGDDIKYQLPIPGIPQDRWPILADYVWADEATAEESIMPAQVVRALTV